MSESATTTPVATTPTPAEAPASLGKLGDDPKLAAMIEKARAKGQSRRQTVYDKTTRGGKSATASAPEPAKKEAPAEAPVEEKKAEPAQSAEEKPKEPEAPASSAEVAEPEAPAAPPVEPEEKVSAKDFVRLRREREKARQVQAEAMRKAQEAEQRAAAIARREAELEADAKLRAEDPYAWARKHNFDLRAIAKKTIAEADGKPAAPEKSPLEAELDAIKAQLAERDRKDQEQEQERIRAQQEAVRQQALGAIHASAAAEFSQVSEDDFPFLKGAYEREDVLASAAQVLQNHYAQTGTQLPWPKVFALMEERAKEYGEKFVKVSAKRTPAAPPAAKAVAPVQASGAVTKSAKPEAATVEALSGPEVTSRDAGASAAAEATPKTRKERREVALQKLQAMQSRRP